MFVVRLMPEAGEWMFTCAGYSGIICQCRTAKVNYEHSFMNDKRMDVSDEEDIYIGANTLY